uniref:LUC7-like (S. cerevisiae) n=1 Tax=Labrus bergylta TaxID=56723 RepID=A0A3Q3FNF6_9LABR
MDLGECTKIHDLALRADYEIASKERDLFFELDAVDHLESFIADCDRRTELAKKRLAETQEEISAEVAAKAEKVHELNEEIGKLLAKAEQLGAEGNVDEAQKVLQEVEKVRTRKKDAEEEYRNSMPASSFQQQKLRVCEVCSAYLGLHDNDRRLADHFGGKLHLGFIQIREKLDQLKVFPYFFYFFLYFIFHFCFTRNTEQVRTKVRHSLNSQTLFTAQAHAFPHVFGDAVDPYVVTSF